MKVKKLLTMLITVAMVFALLPATALAAEEDAESYVYNFKKGLHTDKDGAESKYVSTCVNWNSNDSSEGKWVYEYYSNSTPNGTNVGVYSNGNESLFSFTPRAKDNFQVQYVPEEDSAEGTWYVSLTLKITVDQDGIYSPILSLGTSTNSPIWDVFVSEAKPYNNYYDFVKNLESSNRIGNFDAYGSGEVVEKQFVSRQLNAGDYYLTFVSTSQNEKFALSTSTSDDYYRMILKLAAFELRNVNEIITYNYDITSNALKDTVNPEDFKDVYSSEGTSTEKWQATEMQKLTYEHLKENVNKFAFPADKYTREAQITDKGIAYALYAIRYVLWDGNSYFEDTDGDDIKDTPTSNYANTAYQSSTNVVAKINVPETGDYRLYLYNQENDAEYGCLSNVYFGAYETSLETIIKDTTEEYKLTNRHDSRVAHTDSAEYIGNITVDKIGDYYVIFSPDRQCFLDTGKKTTSVGSGTDTLNGFQKFYLSGIKLEKIPEKSDELVAAQQKYDAIEKTKTDEIASSVASGLSNTATVNILTTEVNSDEAFGETARKETGTYGQVMTVTAEEKEGYEFLYWAKGMGAKRKVVSENAEYTFKAASGGTWLTAVYKSTASDKVSVVFFNGNGEEESRQLVDAGSEITMPTLPALRGHEASIGWALGDKENIYKAGDTVTASGSQMLFVAQFNDPAEDTITVKVNGEVYDKFAYGEKVTVTATERENGSGENVFVYWKKDGEIVSFGKEYSFLAYKDCQLTACYEPYKPVTDALRKIIINADGQNLIAEFIGLDSAVEKGIIFGGDTFASAKQKIAMKQSGNQLAAVNDDSLDYIGYAILSDGSVVYDE